MKELKPGEIIAFGLYPQTAEGTDRTPILKSGRSTLGDNPFMPPQFQDITSFAPLAIQVGR